MNPIEKECPNCNKKFIITKAKEKPKKMCSKECWKEWCKRPEIYQKKHEKRKQNNLQKYGVTHYTNPKKASNTKQSNKQINPDKYKKITKKAEQTKLNKYGTLNFTKKAIKTKINKYGSLSELKLQFTFNTIKEKYNNFEFLFDAGDYNGYQKPNKYNFRCKLCNFEFSGTIGDKGIKCPNCNPKINGVSQRELEVLNFIKSIYNKEIIQHSKQIIYPYEIDIYLPDINLAIEFDGVYWHSEACIEDRNYHLNKTELCLKQGIKLIHVFENEWIRKQDIVKSILNFNITKLHTKLYARDLEIKQISAKECNEFLENNHLQGKDKSSIRYGLFKDNILVSVMTFGKTQYNKKYQYELMRYCTLLNISIIGGTKKLFKHFIHDYNPSSIITYSDRRFFNGNIYKSLGFIFDGYTKPNYFYVINNELKNRQNFQKYKLKDILDIFDPNLSESENMKENGYYRIWDCGNSKWCWNKETIETN